ncbi:hypothetical protein [Salinicoccus carnicancri]|uniref:hypothetical protein n=1 Tax=Salinicoccus carnicancri TaxID=558170 RepID=UPI0002E0D063|nr:hypothetical protein [Salinicoccus carnicancri]
MKTFNQITKSELYEEYIHMKRQIEWLQKRLTQQHEEFLPPEIRDELQRLNKENHDLTVETRRLTAVVNDLRKELAEYQKDITWVM